MSKARLIKRLKWYYPIERLHTFVTFPGILLYLIYSNPISDIIFLTYGILVCIVILYQGQFYWKLKLERLEGKKIDQEAGLHFFRKYKKINRWLFYIMPIFFIIQLYLQQWNFEINDMLFWGVMANLFAILEHINYYHIQLMVDNLYDFKYLLRNKKLKRASLAKDLLEHKL